MDPADVRGLTSWLDAQGLEAGAELTIEPLSGGSSNLMFRLNRGQSRLVLRRPAQIAWIGPMKACGESSGFWLPWMGRRFLILPQLHSARATKCLAVPSSSWST